MSEHFLHLVCISACAVIPYLRDSLSIIQYFLVKFIKELVFCLSETVWRAKHLPVAVNIGGHTYVAMAAKTH